MIHVCVDVGEWVCKFVSNVAACSNLCADSELESESVDDQSMLTTRNPLTQSMVQKFHCLVIDVY